MNRLQDMLYYLIIGLQQWTKSYDHIPEELHRGMLMFMQEAGRSGVEIPTDLHRLLHILHKPSSEWGIQGLNKQIDILVVIRDIVNRYFSLDIF